MRTISEEHKKKLQEGRRAAKDSGVSKTPIDRSNDDPVSIRKAVNAKCYDCVYDPSNGGSWIQQVRNCTQKDCPLWKVRPK